MAPKDEPRPDSAVGEGGDDGGTDELVRRLSTDPSALREFVVQAERLRRRNAELERFRVLATDVAHSLVHAGEKAAQAC